MVFQINGEILRGCYMSESIIKVDNLSKKYLLKHQKRERYTALRDVMSNGIRTLGKKILSPFTSTDLSIAETEEEFYALRDVSFEVKQGDRLGIIGRNGAGKSTLLKVLSRIVEPTAGRIEITGRVASLLEVGTGFHPELTGRENIFLNGAILGMGKAEIKRKFDEIVDFAEVEKFLDTPVKRYSSGMYVRLAFAVAAHLEPEILIVDEVLAVGDAQFQKKCLGKMEEVGKEGRTVLFVSHNMMAISALCSNAVVLEKGSIKSQGDVNKQIEVYLKTFQDKRNLRVSKRIMNSIEIDRFELIPNPVESCKNADFIIQLSSIRSVSIEAIAILFYSELRTRVAILDLRRQTQYLLKENVPLTIKGSITSLPFVEGTYDVGLYFKSGGTDENHLDLLNLQIQGKTIQQNIVPYPSEARGFIELNANFKVTEYINDSGSNL
jgi:lipopolysaccharide transport system ATP-binding protein